MTRSPRQFERAMRPLVRERLRTSPALWDEYQQARRARWPGRLLRIGVTAVGAATLPLAALIALERDRQVGGAKLVLATLACWSLAAAGFYACLFRFAIRRSPQRNALAHLPITDRAIARRCSHVAVGTVSVIVICTTTVGYAIIAVNEERLSIADCLVLPACCVAQWLAVMAAGTAMALARPKKDDIQPVEFLSVLFGLLFLSHLALDSVLRDWPQALDTTTLAVLTATPGGWISVAWWLGWLNGARDAWWTLVPLGLLIVVALGLRRRLFATFVAAEPPKSFQRVDSFASLQLLRAWLAWRDWARGETPYAKTAPLPAEEAFRRIRTRAFVGPPAWSGLNALDRACNRLLTRREMLLAELLSVDGPHWTRAARRFLALVIVSWIVFLRLPGLAPHFPMLVMFSAFSLSFLPAWDGRRPFSPLPDLAAFAVAPRQVASFIMKVGLVRSLVLLVVALVADVATSQAAQPAEYGALAFAVVGFAVVAESWRAAWRMIERWRLPALRWRIGYGIVLGAAYLASVAGALNLFGFFVIVSAAARIGLGLDFEMWIELCGTFGLYAVLGVGSAIFVLWFCLYLHSSGRCDMAPVVRSNVEPFNEAAAFRWVARRRRRLVLRQQFGLFWWLPRHMLAARAEEAAS